jgi:hypothetical protein
LTKVKQLFTKCEAFSNSLQIGEEEEVNQENDLSFEGENEEGEALAEEFGRRSIIIIKFLERNARSSSTSPKIRGTSTLNSFCR